jgi:hypothetical protein
VFCPYCAEEISKDAMVCKHCKRDLAVLLRALEKVDLLEAEVARLRATRFTAPAASVEGLVMIAPAEQVTPGGPAILWIYALALGTAAACISMYYVYGRLQLSSAQVAWAMIAAPSLVGGLVARNFCGMVGINGRALGGAALQAVLTILGVIFSGRPNWSDWPDLSSLALGLLVLFLIGPGWPRKRSAHDPPARNGTALSELGKLINKLDELSPLWKLLSVAGSLGISILKWRIQ